MQRTARPLLALAICLISLRAFGQYHDSCIAHDWVGINQEAAGSSGLLCQGVADIALDRSTQGRRILLQVIKSAPRSDSAFEAHEALSTLYERTGQVRKAARETSSLLALHPGDKGLVNDRSVFAALARFPDMTVAHLRPVSFPRAATQGSLNIPFTVNGKSATFYVDTGCNLSVISDDEARALGLTIIPVSSTLQDIGGLTSPVQVTEIEELTIGPIRLRHVPFLVMPAAQSPFKELPKDSQGLFGIQVAIALQSIRLDANGQLDLAFPNERSAHAPHFTFSDLGSVLHLRYRARLVPFTFDTGAAHTMLYLAFARDFPETVSLGAKTNHDVRGFGGTAHIDSIVLPSWTIDLGGRTATIPSMPVLLEKTTDASEWAAGNLGIDMIQQVTPFTIDFRNMQLILGN